LKQTPLKQTPLKQVPFEQGRVAGAATPLLGTFELTGGSCAGAASGTYFRMLQPGGALNGPESGYITNTDSSCADKTYTALARGSDRGLVTGAYQPEPTPAFDKSGNSLADRIVQPAKFFGVRFSLSTAAKDPQTGLAVTAPSIVATGGALSGDLRAFSASWNSAHFNQGSPKPDGSAPGLEGSGLTGTYDAATNAFTIEWTSLIVGGPFGGFTGQWHLTGHFAAAGVSPAPTTTTTSAVGPSPDATASSGPVAPELANTGSDTDLLLAIGGFLIVLGGMVQRSANPSVIRTTLVCQWKN
jgi:hypothetical protein